MTVKFSTGLRDGMLNSTGVKEAFTNGTLHIYSGPQPATADAAVTGTLLLKITESGGTFTPGATANGINFGAPSGGVIAKATAETWTGTGATAGTAGWFRLMGNATDAGGTSTALPRIDGTVATSGGDLNLVSTTIASGTPITIDTFALTLPAS